MTLTPQPTSSPSYPPSLCILCGDAAVQDTILNIILFIPFGLGMRLAGFRRRHAIVIAACTTITVELLQMHIIPGRDSSLGDVLTNTLGGALGVWLADTWRLWVLPAAPQARRLVWCGAVVWAAIFTATAWGLQRALPDTTLWGQWQPELLHLDRFPGTILRASAAGYPFPPGARGGDPTFRRRLRSDSVLVQASVIPGPSTQRMAPILGVYDWRKTQIFLLGQRGRALLFSIRTNAGRALLRDPLIELNGVFQTAASADDAHPDTVRVSGGVLGGALIVRAHDAEHGSRERRVPLSPGLGWSFFMPWGYAYGPETPLFSWLWVAGLLFPVVYWRSRSERQGEGIGVVIGAVLVGLVAAPVLFHGNSASWPEWLGVAAAVALGTSTAALGGGTSGQRHAMNGTASPDAARRRPETSLGENNDVIANREGPA